MLLACLLAASALLAQDAAGPAAMVPGTYDRPGTGFRDSFERLKARGYDTYVAELAAAHPSHRAHAATMLGVIGDRRAIPVLRKFIATETSETTRHSAYVGVALLGDDAYLSELLKALARDIAEYPDWVKTGIPNNPLASAARSFRVLAEYEIALPPAVIDELFRRLDHVDSGVTIDAAAALQHATGIGFGFRGDVSDRRSYASRAEAWRTWWRDNRARYQAKQNYVVNGLELVVSSTGDRLTATFHNRGASTLKLSAPAPDTVTARRETRCEPFGPSLVLVDGRGGLVQQLRSDTGPCSAHFVPSDDVLHWDSIELTPGAAYSFTLPAVATREPVALAYQTAACGAGRWCGEVRSNLVGP